MSHTHLERKRANCDCSFDYCEVVVSLLCSLQNNMKFSYVYGIKYIFIGLLFNCMSNVALSPFNSNDKHQKSFHTWVTNNSRPVGHTLRQDFLSKTTENKEYRSKPNLKIKYEPYLESDNTSLSSKYERANNYENLQLSQTISSKFSIPNIKKNISRPKSNFRPIVALNYAQRNSRPKYKFGDYPKQTQLKAKDTSDCSPTDDFVENHEDIIDYPLNSTFFKTIEISARVSLKVLITSVDKKYADFLVVQVHSQNYRIILSYDKVPKNQRYVNNTNTGLVVFIQKSVNYSRDPAVYVHNFYPHEVSVLLLVRNYTNKEPVPGGLFSSNSTQSIPHPYLFLNQNLLTTWISFPLATLYNISYLTSPSGTLNATDIKPVPITPSKLIRYEVYLTYMYEGDLFEEHYWQSVIKTSTIEGLKQNATKVSEIDQLSSNWIHELFVSYSGVGAVVNVVASFNNSEGVLYSSTVFYGCDFIKEEQYNCTKLVSPLAKLFCASLPFLGIILLFFGHRWLNFTMFVAGFLASWFILFVIFVHVPNRNIEVLGVCTLLGALAGGIGWLVVWHKFHRPFYSALLIILLSSFFTAMISTHFLKYALVPTRHNIAAFIVFPVAFSVTVIAYSIFDIKKVHIFACCLLGSYAVVMPFAFYFGSSLTYIVINVVSAMTVRRFSEAVGYPPFQYCDIVLLCVWILLFILGTCYQTYCERSGPPFYPPNLSSLKTILAAFNLVKEKTSLCLCRQPPDDDSLFEDRPSFTARFASFCSPGRRNREHLSAYESFPRIGSEDEGSSLKEMLTRPFRSTYEFLRQAATRFHRRFGGTETLQEETNNEVDDDVEPLESHGDEENKETELEGDPVQSPLGNGQV